MSIKERIRRSEDLYNKQVKSLLETFVKSERGLDDYDVFNTCVNRASQYARIRIVAFDGNERKLYENYCKIISATEGAVQFSAWDKLSVKVQTEWIELMTQREQQIFNDIHNKKSTLILGGKGNVKQRPLQTDEERYQEFRARADRFEQMLEGENPIKSYARDIEKRVDQLTDDEYKAACQNYKALEMQRDICYKKMYEIKNAQKGVDKSNI